jgi:hypothetical protein
MKALSENKDKMTKFNDLKEEKTSKDSAELEKEIKKLLNLDK